MDRYGGFGHVVFFLRHGACFQIIGNGELMARSAICISNQAPVRNAFSLAEPRSAIERIEKYDYPWMPSGGNVSRGEDRLPVLLTPIRSTLLITV